MTTGNEMRARAKAHMPMVLLTLLSILQALALELLWTHVREHAYLLEANWIAFLAWVQVAATLIGVLLIWILYSSMVMRFRWVPSSSDSLVPFLIGVLEFAMIASLGPDFLAWWFILLGILYGVAAAALQNILRRARRDGDNDAFFARVPPATRRDFYPDIAIVTALIAIGVSLGGTGHTGAFAMLGLLIATAVLLHQMHLNTRYWNQSMTRDGLPEGSEGTDRPDVPDPRD